MHTSAALGRYTGAGWYTTAGAAPGTTTGGAARMLPTTSPVTAPTASPPQTGLRSWSRLWW